MNPNADDRTCAACDCPIDGDAVSVTVGGKTVEVCCDDCARALNEAHAAAVGLAPRPTV